jgi:uncharacterized protein YfiM (DUF2279 family)
MINSVLDRRPHPNEVRHFLARIAERLSGTETGLTSEIAGETPRHVAFRLSKQLVLRQARYDARPAQQARAGKQVICLVSKP